MEGAQLAETTILFSSATVAMVVLPPHSFWNTRKSWSAAPAVSPLAMRLAIMAGTSRTVASV